MTLAEEDEGLHQQLEMLFVNNPDFDRLSQSLNRFNPIRVMKMEFIEIRHSAILAWLLDPGETHGLGDVFLKSFLAEAFRGTMTGPSAIEITQSDLRDAEVQREKKNMDLFIVTPNKGWAFVIENKVSSKQHSGQLDRYISNAKKIAKSQGNSLKVHGVFLTLDEESLSDTDQVNYTSLRYYQLCTILGDLLRGPALTIDDEARRFIEYYHEIIEDLCGMSKSTHDMKDLAVQLFRTHQTALEFIMEHGSVNAFSAACDMHFGSDRKKGHAVKTGQIYGGSSPTRFNYIPEAWQSLLEQSDLNKGCENWHMGYALGCWFDLRRTTDSVKGKLFLNFEVGPVADHQQRLHLIYALSEVGSPVKFSKVAERKDTKYSRFLSGNSKEIADIGDPELIDGAIGGLISKFSKTTDSVTKALLALKADEREAE